MKPIRALLVDDEAHARETLRLRLAEESHVEVIGECRNGREALAAIRSQQPDLVFLDVRMPDLSGFEVLEELRDGELPHVVFVTAYDDYALRAFDVHALAYLLKPFDDQRFEEAMRHVRRVLTGSGRDDRREVRALLAELRGIAQGEPGEDEPSGASHGYLRRLVVKLAGRTYLVRAEEIDWIEAEGNYARLHVGAHSHLVSKTLAELAERLDPHQFTRIHRSAIVNLDRIQELRTEDHRDFTVALRGGTKLRMSRTYRHLLEQALGDRI